VKNQFGGLLSGVSWPQTLLRDRTLCDDT